MNPEIPKDVLLRARLGDHGSFRTVAEALAKYTFNLAYRMTYNRTDAEDLTQEILLRLFQNLKRYDPDYPFPPWFRRLATNCAINWKQRVANRTQTSLESVAPPQREDRPPADPNLRLQDAIRQLPADYQACITLRYLENLGVQEIAACLAVPVGTVKTWLFRARDFLKETLRPYVEQRQ